MERMIEFINPESKDIRAKDSRQSFVTEASMKTEYQIYLDYQNAIRQADKLEKLADELNKVGGKDYERELDQIRMSWNGENADKFLHASSVILSRNSKNVKKMRDIASVIRKTAENTMQAELKALEIAKKREY